MGVSPTIPPTNLSPAIVTPDTQQPAGASPALTRFVQPPHLDTCPAMPGAPRHGAACSINSSFLDARPTHAGGSPAEPHAPASWPTSDACPNTTGASPTWSPLKPLGLRPCPSTGGSPIRSRSLKSLGPTGHLSLQPGTPRSGAAHSSRLAQLDLSHLPGAPRRQGRGFLGTPQVNIVILPKLPQNLVKGPTLARHRSTNSRPAT